MPPFSLCLGFLLISSFNIVQAQQQNLSSSFMHLTPALNLSFLASYSLPGGHPISYDRMFAVGILNEDSGLFFPILSSPLFNSSETPGFSFGLYGWPCNNAACTLYLAVCGGTSGNTTRDSLQSTWSFPASPAPVVRLYPYTSVNGGVVPLWMANRDNPIQYAGNASLVLAFQPRDNSIVQELQLRDGDRVVWNVSNAAMMEMSDSGEFRIYDSANATVFQAARSTFTRDALLEGERMTAGMELTSRDSAYTARMEKGGLALYMNGMGAQAPPYWIFPLPRDPPGQSRQSTRSMNELISSAPCSNTSYYSGYVQLVTGFSGVSLDFFVEPRSCTSSFSNQYFYHYPIPGVNGTLGWSFLRMEIDGGLYIYSVSRSSRHGNKRGRVDTIYSGIQTFVRLPDSAGGTVDKLVAKPTSMITSPITSMVEGTSAVPFCNVPLACGPLGVCAPSNETGHCRCPHESLFEPINIANLQEGCQPRTSLPLCSGRSSQPINTTFLELQSTASIFLFINDWTFNSIQDDDTCKQACASDCSCLGVSYQVSTSSCLLIQHNMSLVSVLDSIVTIWNYSATSIDGFPLTKQIFAHDYVTHLKVAASTPPSPSRSNPRTTIPPSPSRSNRPRTTIPSLAAVHNPRARFPLMSLIGIIPFCAFFIGLGAIYHLMKIRRRGLLQQANEEEELRDILPLLPSRFSYKQLHEATKSFSTLLGAGGCGSVYAGVLLDGRKVAVKVLEGSTIARQGARQCREFLAEVAAVGRTGHQNIVRLLGFCWQASHRILVYEYLERGSLDRWLFERPAVEGPKRFLEWHRRYDIALGIARGLRYLHEECEQDILHFDIKPQNILLDDAFVAKISDFGLSRLMQRDISAVMSGLRGTPGYIAPEWLSHATISKKVDVYGMGIVMLEIVAGRRVLEYSQLFNSKSSSAKNSSELQEAWHLPSWAAQKVEQGRLMDIVDKRLYLSGFDDVQVQRLLYAAFWCIHEDPAMRPHAATVVQWLENTDLLIQPPPISFTSATTNSILQEHARAAASSSSSTVQGFLTQRV